MPTRLARLQSDSITTHHSLTVTRQCQCGESPEVVACPDDAACSCSRRLTILLATCSARSLMYLIQTERERGPPRAEGGHRALQAANVASRGPREGKVQGPRLSPSLFRHFLLRVSVRALKKLFDALVQLGEGEAHVLGVGGQGVHTHGSDAAVPRQAQSTPGGRLRLQQQSGLLHPSLGRSCARVCAAVRCVRLLE